MSSAGAVKTGFVSPFMFVSEKPPSFPLQEIKPLDTETALLEKDPPPVTAPVESIDTMSPESSAIVRIGGTCARTGIAQQTIPRRARAIALEEAVIGRPTRILLTDSRMQLQVGLTGYTREE